MSKQTGFTLLEVLIVIGIMGLIAAMVSPRFGGIRDAAGVVIRDNNQQRMTAAVASYWEDHEVFPSGLVNLVYEVGSVGVEEYTGSARYKLPTHEGNLVHEGKVTFDEDFYARLKPQVHILDEDEARELRRMGIMNLYNLNSYDYDGVKEVFSKIDATRDRMRQVGRGITDDDPRIRDGLGVLMVGLGWDSSAENWMGTATTEASIRTTGWTHPESIGRIILGLGPETELINKDIISSAGLCPDGLRNDRTTWNHYSLLLPRLQATVDRMNATSSLDHLKLITARPANGPVREFNLLTAQPRYRFNIYSPSGLLGNDPENNVTWEIIDPATEP